jgi:hypothetical protein
VQGHCLGGYGRCSGRQVQCHFLWGLTNLDCGKCLGFDCLRCQHVSQIIQLSNLIFVEVKVILATDKASKTLWAAAGGGRNLQHNYHEFVLDLLDLLQQEEESSASSNIIMDVAANTRL